MFFKRRGLSVRPGRFNAWGAASALALLAWSSPSDADSELTCGVGGTVTSVLEGNTYSYCDLPGVAHSLGATGGDGSLALSNSEALTFSAPTNPFGYPAIHVYAPPFHIEREFRMEYRILADGSIGLVPIEYSFFSMNQLETDNLDLFSQPITVNNSGAITGTGNGVGAITARGSIESVTVRNSGAISLTGNFTSGIFAMTGVAPGFGFDFPGVAPGTYRPGGAISIENSGAIDLQGSYSSVILAHTLAGGITIGNSGSITTHGENTAAIRAMAESNAISITNSAALSLNGPGSEGIAADMLLPGRVTIVNDGAIAVDGDRGTGIRAVNADAGEDASGAETRITGRGAISVTGEDATGIDASNRLGGSLVVDYAGRITVNGAYAVGIAANTEEGASVSVKVNADVIATGPSAVGIAVAGIGEGSGPDENNAYTPANTGRLSVEIAKGVTVQGGSTGEGDYVIEKLGAGVAFAGGADNSLVNRGTIAAASGIAVAAVEGLQEFVELDPESGQEQRLLVNFKAGPLNIQNYGAINGAIITGSGHDTVVNQGLGVISGNIDLGGGTNSLLNRDDAVINSRDLIGVGAGNTFTNSGILNPGGLGTIQRTTIIGNFVQTSGGRLIVDLHEASRKSDFLGITGTASLGGSVIPNFLVAPVEVKSEYHIISAAGGVTSTGLAADPSRQVGDTVGYDFGLSYRDGTNVYLTADKRADLADLAGAAAGANSASGAQQTNLASVGGALSAIEKQGGSAMGALINALRLSPNLETMGQTMNRLVPQNQGAQASNTSSSGASFGNAMLSCTEREGPNAYTREGQCYWAKVTARRLDRDATAAGAGVEETATEIAGGVQVKMWDQLRLGLALGWEDLHATSFDTRQRLGEGDGGRFQAGVVVKNQWGPVNAYLNLAGSWAKTDLDRYVNIAGVGGVAQADQDVTSFISKLRLSYLLDQGPWYLKPLVDVSATHVRLGGYTETGAGAANLTVASTGDWIFGFSPGVEIGMQVTTADGTILRPYARAGATFLDTDEVAVQTSFSAAPGVPFTVKGRIEDVYGDLEAGLHILTTAGINMRLNYEGRYAEDSRQHAGSVKLSAPW